MMANALLMHVDIECKMSLFRAATCIRRLSNLNCPTSFYVPHLWLHVWPSSLALMHCSDSTQDSHIDLLLAHLSAPKYLRVLFRLPSSVVSSRLLRSLDWHDLFVPWCEDYYFSDIGSALYNQHPPLTCSSY